MTDAARAFHDAVAEDHADHFRDVFAARPLEPAPLTGFAGLVGAGGEVAGRGYDPGWVTATRLPAARTPSASTCRNR
ncbi:hypothetical protein [Streptomyces sp. NPDC055186]